MLTKVKTICAKFWPVTISRFNSAKKDVKKQVRELEKQIHVVEKQIVQLSLLVEQKNEENRDKLVELQQSIQKVSEATQSCVSAIDNVTACIPNQTIYWKNMFEKRVVEANWGDVSKESDFADKFIRLTQGMDEESIRTIIKILARQRKYLNSDSKQMDLFTREEQEQLRLLDEEFYSEILELSDDLYAYRQYLLPGNKFEASVFYYKHGISQLKTVSKVEGMSIVDVGGYVGDSVLVLEELKPRDIYTFEAFPDNYELLQKTIKLNNLSNVVAENVALGAEKGICKMHIAGSSTSSLQREGVTYSGEVEVPVVTLDEYVEEHQLKIGLIKVDIEGAEPEFLQGAKKTICSQKPIILLSIYHNAHDFFELKPLLESWNVGYQFQVHKPIFGSISGEVLLLAEVVED